MLMSSGKQIKVEDTESDDNHFLKKILKLNNGEILTRLNNGVIQVHFNDLTSLFLNREDDKGLFYINKKGRVSEINYKECQNPNLRKKIRYFSNLMKKLSEKQNEKATKQK